MPPVRTGWLPRAPAGSCRGLLPASGELGWAPASSNRLVAASSGLLQAPGQGRRGQGGKGQGAGGHCGNPSIARGTLLFVAFCCVLIIFCCFWLLLAAFSCFFVAFWLFLASFGCFLVAFWFLLDAFLMPFAVSRCFALLVCCFSTFF